MCMTTSESTCVPSVGKVSVCLGPQGVSCNRRAFWSQGHPGPSEHVQPGIQLAYDH